jgi:hypothetical protein
MQPDFVACGEYFAQEALEAPCPAQEDKEGRRSFLLGQRIQNAGSAAGVRAVVVRDDDMGPVRPDFRYRSCHPAFANTLFQQGKGTSC